MLILASILAVAVASLAAALWWFRRKWADDYDELRRKYADLHMRFDVATAEIHVAAREHVIGALAKTEDFDVLDAVTDAFDTLPKPERTEKAIDAFRERMAMAKSAEVVANTGIKRTADEAIVVKAENSLLRSLLEKAVLLPADTPEQKRKMLLEHIQLNLSAPRADLSALADEHFRAYVERHADATGEKLEGSA